MSKRDYYEILGVSKTVETAELKKAYRALAVQYHPDKNPGNKEAEDKFKEASEAYEILSNAEKRQIYDQFGHAGIQGGGFGGGGFAGMEDISDIFEDFFGFSSGRRQRNRPTRGDDMRYDLEIEFKEACFGCEKQINVVKEIVCAVCEGSGAKDPNAVQVCGRCRGSGQVGHSQGFFTISTTCPTCQGAGRTVTDHCKECRGKGKVRDSKKLTVKVPPGVDTGVRLMLHAEGMAGERGGPPGDLYVVLHVRADEHFQREGDTIHTMIKVSMVDAALGVDVSVPTLEGEKVIHVPKGTQSGQNVKIKEGGVVNLRSKRKGDQIVTIIVMTPEHLSKEQEECLKKFREISGTEKGSEKKKKKGIFG